MIMVAGVLDGIDGRIARLLHGESRFGAELDSLSDAISFGVAPALILYLWSLQALPRVGWICALVFAVFCALRLARFNAQIDVTEQPHKSAGFLTGVPAPAGAGLALLPIYLWFWTDEPTVRARRVLVAPWVAFDRAADGLERRDLQLVVAAAAPQHPVRGDRGGRAARRGADLARRGRRSASSASLYLALDPVQHRELCAGSGGCAQRRAGAGADAEPQRRPRSGARATASVRQRLRRGLDVAPARRRCVATAARSTRRSPCTRPRQRQRKAEAQN